MKNKPPVIEEVVQLMLDGEFKKSRKEAIERGMTILNPHFFEQGKLISFHATNKHIVCKETQPGVSPDEEYYTINVAYFYEDYQPYYDEWIKPYNRDKKLESLGI